jgi:hypothetical protein
MADPDQLCPRSSLAESEQTVLLQAHQPVLDTEALTCSFDRKLERMHTFVKTRGVSITEEETRSPRGRKAGE